jgi:hypothetical protein
VELIPDLLALSAGGEPKQGEIGVGLASRGFSGNLKDKAFS